MLAILNNHRPYNLLSQFLFFSFFIFVAGFFFFPSEKSHNSFYYVFVLIPGLFYVREWFSYMFTKKDITSTVLLALVLYMALTTLWSPSIDLGDIGVALKRTFYLIVLFSVIHHLRKNHSADTDNALFYICILSGAIAAYGIYTHAHTTRFMEARLALPPSIESPILAGCAMGFISVLSLFLFYKLKGATRKTLIMVTFLISIIFLLLSQSRLPIVATFITIIAYVFLKSKNNKKTAMILFASCSALAVLFYFSGYIEILTSRGLAFRLDIWGYILEQSKLAPFFGHGIRSDNDITILGQTFQHSHSLYFGTLRDGGLAGIILLFLFIALSLWKGIKEYLSNTRDPYYIVFILYALLAVSADSDRLISHPKDFWLYFWFPILFFAPGNDKKI